MALKGKKAAFVLEYPVDLNGAEAARRAGYSAKTAAQKAWTLLQEPEIKEAIEAAIGKRRERIKVDQDYVIDGLVEVVERSLERVPVLDALGTPTGRWTFNGSVANRALELLGKHQGMFKDQVDHTIGLRLTHEEALAALE